MALPIIDVPLYQLNLPSTGEMVGFRPFLVKEQKILLLAAESKEEKSMLTAAKQIINNCTMGKLKIENLTTFDIEYLFLKIRAKSVGEISEFFVKCDKCENSVKVSIDLDKVEIKKDPNHSRKIMLTDSVGIMMKYPGIDAQEVITNTNNVLEKEFKVIMQCVEYIFDKEQLFYPKDTPEKDFRDFFESLTSDNYKKIEKFFLTTPKLEETIHCVCSKCSHEFDMVASSLVDFFA